MPKAIANTAFQPSASETTLMKQIPAQHEITPHKATEAAVCGFHGEVE